MGWRGENGLFKGSEECLPGQISARDEDTVSIANVNTFDTQNSHSSDLDF